MFKFIYRHLWRETIKSKIRKENHINRWHRTVPKRHRRQHFYARIGGIVCDSSTIATYSPCCMYICINKYKWQFRASIVEFDAEDSGPISQYSRRQYKWFYTFSRIIFILNIMNKLEYPRRNGAQKIRITSMYPFSVLFWTISGGNAQKRPFILLFPL